MPLLAADDAVGVVAKDRALLRFFPGADRLGDRSIVQAKRRLLPQRRSFAHVRVLGSDRLGRKRFGIRLGHPVLDCIVDHRSVAQWTGARSAFASGSKTPLLAAMRTITD